MLIAKVQEIFYAIGTRILKIDIEIVEIIEVKVSYFSASGIAKCQFLNDGCQL